MAGKKEGAGHKGAKKGRGRPRKEDAIAAQVRRKELIAEALEYRRQGFKYRQIAETMEISTATAYEYVQEGLEAIVLEPAVAVKKLVLDRYDDMLQQLMPLLEDGAPDEVVDKIIKINDKILALHGLTGGINLNLPGADGEDGDDEAVVIARIKATAPVLRPDAPVPAKPIL